MHAVPVELASKTSHRNQQESTWTPNGLLKENLNSFLTLREIESLGILKAKEKQGNWDLDI